MPLTYANISRKNAETLSTFVGVEVLLRVYHTLYDTWPYTIPLTDGRECQTTVAWWGAPFPALL